jgi:hypothetical protein
MLAICPTCLKEFKVRGPQKYCSYSCQTTARAKREHPKISKQCKHCGKVFVAKKHMKFCSLSCNLAAKIKVWKEEKRKCEYCGETFSPIREKQKHCSRTCNRKDLFSRAHDRKRFSGNREARWAKMYPLRLNRILICPP